MIQDYEEKYDNQIKKLLHENQYYLPWGAAAEITLLTVYDNKVVAIGSLWKKEIHPYRNYMGIYVSPNNRNKGIGTNLYNQLTRISNIDKFQTAIFSTDKIATRFLNKTGFNLTRKCYETDLSSPDFEHLEEEKITYSTLNDDKIKELMQLHLQNYKDTHRKINPLNEKITLKEWEKIITSDLDIEHSFVLIKNNNIVAYLLCYEGDQDGEIEIGYIGGKDKKDLKNYIPYYKACLSDLFKRFEKVIVEADDIDPYAFAVLNLFDYDIEKSFDTYII